MKKVTSEYLQGCRVHGVAMLEVVLLVVSDDEGPVSVGFFVSSLEVSFP